MTSCHFGHTREEKRLPTAKKKGIWGARWSLEHHPNSLHCSGASCLLTFTHAHLPSVIYSIVFQTAIFRVAMLCTCSIRALSVTPTYIVACCVSRPPTHKQAVFHTLTHGFLRPYAWDKYTFVIVILRPRRAAFRLFIGRPGLS